MSTGEKYEKQMYWKFFDTPVALTFLMIIFRLNTFCVGRWVEVCVSARGSTKKSNRL